MLSRPACRRWISFAVVAAAILVPGWGGADDEGEPEIIKGTVAIVRPSALYLTDIGSPDEAELRKDIMVAVDDDTEYYDAARRITRDDIVPGLKVIARCRNGSDGRKALQVRIVGGKTP